MLYIYIYYIYKCQTEMYLRTYENDKIFKLQLDVPNRDDIN